MQTILTFEFLKTKTLHKHSLFPLSLFFLLSLLSRAQPTEQAKSLQRQYLEKMQTAADIYQGKQYYGFPPAIKGDAYLWPQSSPVDIHFKGTIYYDLPARFDIVNQWVLLDHPQLLQTVILPSEFIYRFGLEQRSFKKFHLQGLIIFLEELHPGSPSLYAHRRKIVRERASAQRLEKWFERDDRFYLLRGEELHEISRRRDLIRLFPEHKNEIKSFLRTADLNIRRDTEKSLKAVVAFLNEKGA